MAADSKIEWTDATWNPVTGCSVVSPGCTNCYAMRLAGTRLHHPSRAGLTKPSKARPVWTGEVRLNEEWLTQPLRWRRPRMIFVCAHGDLFHESVPDEWIDRVFAVMALAPQHTFQVLTKRAKRMREFISRFRLSPPEDGFVTRDGVWSNESPAGAPIFSPKRWPLPNVWLGVSAERQQEADARVPDLLATPAAIRFVSCEPLLGPIDLWPWIDPQYASREGTIKEFIERNEHTPRLDWVIVGGENGDRPMHPDWARLLRDQCVPACVPFFFKQWGTWGIETTTPVFAAAGSLRAHTTVASTDRKRIGQTSYFAGRGEGMRTDVLARLGKKVAGRLLDGREWNEMPEVMRQ